VFHPGRCPSAARPDGEVITGDFLQSVRNVKMKANGIFVTATDTEVGKTFVSGLLMQHLAWKGLNPGYFKPVASGCYTENGRLMSEDLAWIGRFLGEEMPPELHCPLRFEKPLAPLAAARLEGREVDLGMVREAFGRLRGRYSTIVVEGIGGVMVPLRQDYLVLDLIAETALPALIVARPVLGTINHTLLTLEALRARRLPVLGFVTNGARDEADEAAGTSPGIIAELGGIPYLGHIPFHDPGRDEPESYRVQVAPLLEAIWSICQGEGASPVDSGWDSSSSGEIAADFLE